LADPAYNAPEPVFSGLNCFEWYCAPSEIASQIVSLHLQCRVFCVLAGSAPAGPHYGFIIATTFQTILQMTEAQALAIKDFQKRTGRPAQEYEYQKANQRFFAAHGTNRSTSKQETGFIGLTGYFNLVKARSSGPRYALTGSSINRQIRESKKKSTASPSTDEETARGAADPQPRIFSSRSKANVKAKSTAFFRAEKEKTFLTLTFIRSVSDRDAVKVLNKFRTVLKKEYPDLEYIWVIERQENGRPHFHAILNKFIPFRRWQALWVLQQYNAGLEHPDYSREEIQLRYENTMNGLRGKEKMNIESALNPLTIQKVSGINALARYLTKYITKGDNGGQWDCQVWHCSRKVSQLFTRAESCEQNEIEAVGFENALIDHKTGEIMAMPKVWKDPTSKQVNYTIVTYHQPAYFLKYLKGLERVNRWILRGEVTAAELMRYFDPDRRT
jgi:hypothetical protein